MRDEFPILAIRKSLQIFMYGVKYMKIHKISPLLRINY